MRFLGQSHLETGLAMSLYPPPPSPFPKIVNGLRTYSVLQNHHVIRHYSVDAFHDSSSSFLSTVACWYGYKPILSDHLSSTYVTMANNIV